MFCSLLDARCFCREHVQKPRQETYYKELVQRSYVIRDLLRRSCQETCHRDLAPVFYIETLTGTYHKKLDEGNLHSISCAYILQISLQRISRRSSYRHLKGTWRMISRDLHISPQRELAESPASLRRVLCNTVWGFFAG